MTFVKKSILLSIVFVLMLYGVGCGKRLEDYTVFDTENVKSVTLFVSDNDDGVIVSEEKLSEIVEWLGTFSVGEKTGETLIPGIQNDRVQIEYENGDMVEGKMATIVIEDVRYYLEYEEIPQFYFNLTKITANESEQSQVADVEMSATNQNASAPYVVNTYEVTNSELLNEYFENDKLVTMVEHYEMSDGTWKTDDHIYQYRLEITGRMGGAVKDSIFVFLSNMENISFDQAWKASGLSSNMNDYFKPEDAKLVGLK